MGNDLTKEYPSTWNETSVQEWKQTAANIQKNYYLAFQGRQWDEYTVSDRNLLRVKVCYAIFGLPKECNNNIEKIEDAYDKKQQDEADKITDKIIKVYEDSPATTLQVGIVFICCKQEANEFILPIFRIKVAAPSNDKDYSKFVDRNCRVYSDWNDWKNNNTLPMLKYCYPKYGFYSCSNSCEYKFDPEENPNVEFGTSPACDFSSRLGRQVDVASSVTSLTSAGIGIAAMFTPLAPVVLTTSAIVGISSAIYGTARSVNRLVDKGTHDESLTDLESVTCWLMIVATPAHFATSITNAALASGARSGRVFTSTIRAAATILNCSVFGLDSAMIVIGLANLVRKYEEDQLTTLDVVQFSISVFFFSHTLIQPKTASGLIKQVQKQHIAEYGRSIQDSTGAQAFEKFLNDNKSNDQMNSNAKIIRTINRIDDPNKFFTMASKADSLIIGGRKGKTVLINGEVRINPNMATKYSGSEIFTRGAFQPINAAARAELHDKGAQAFGAASLSDVSINGKRLFQEMTPTEIERLQNVLKNTARNYNKDIIQTAQTLAIDIKCNSVSDFCALVELVALEGQGKRGTNLANHLQELLSNPQRKNNFINEVKQDIVEVRRLQKGSTRFKSDLNAVYHYRKHGHEFAAEPRAYFKDIPQELFHSENLVCEYLAKDGKSICSVYANPNPDGTFQNQFGVLLTDTNGKAKVATIFPKTFTLPNPGQMETLSSNMNQLANQPSNSVAILSFLSDMLSFF